MLLNCGYGEDSWESLGQQGDQTNQSSRKSILNIHWKDWCWSCSYNILTTWCKEPTHWKRPWCWKRLRAGEGGKRMRWLNSITDSMEMCLRKLWEIVKDEEAWCAAGRGITKSKTQLSDWTTIIQVTALKKYFLGWPPKLASVQFSRSVLSDSLRPHESQHARPPCPSPTPRVHSDSHPLSQWCHPAISSSVIPFSSCPQSLPASESFPMSQLFAWGGQSTAVSALPSFLP